MAIATRTGLLAIGQGLVASAVAGLALSMALPVGTQSPAGVKSYAIAISGRSSLRLIALQSSQRTTAPTLSPGDRQLYCRYLARAAGLELGVGCASEPTALADASQ